MPKPLNMDIKIHEAIIILIFSNNFFNMYVTSTPVNTATYFPISVDIRSKSVEFVNIIKEDLRHNNDDYSDKALYNISNPYLHTRSTTTTHTVHEKKMNTKAAINYGKLYDRKAQNINNNLFKGFKRRAYSLDSGEVRKPGKVLYPQDAEDGGNLADSQEARNRLTLLNSQEAGKHGKLLDSQDAGKRGTILYPQDPGKLGERLNSQEAGNRGKILYPRYVVKHGKILYPQDPAKSGALLDSEDAGKRKKVLDSQDLGKHGIGVYPQTGKLKKILNSHIARKRGKVFNYTVKDNKIVPIERPVAPTTRNSKRFLKVTDRPEYERFTNQYTKYVDRNKAEKLLQIINNKNSLLDNIISRNKIESQTVALTLSVARADDLLINDPMSYAVPRAMPRDVVFKLPSPDQLDMAHAKGPRIHSMRIKGRLCHRSVLHPEGPKYNSKGNIYQSGFVPRGIGSRRRDFNNTRSPPLLLPRCCNCCKKSVLGCE